ncbi:hypothetical protein AAVH_03113 [Aphelenchoides avenae]|nr:hypothetical protein AAVH_03113 [Aphelenchus avenae]
MIFSEAQNTQGKQEWKHTNASGQGSSQRTRGTPECCDSEQEEPSNIFTQRSYSQTERTPNFATSRTSSSSSTFEIPANTGVYQRMKDFITDWSPSWLTSMRSAVTTSLRASLPAEGTVSRRVLDALWQAFLWAPWLCWRLLLLLLWMTFGILVIVGRIIVNIIHSDKLSERGEQTEQVTPREQSVDNVRVLKNLEGSDYNGSTLSTDSHIEDAPDEEAACTEPIVPADGSSEKLPGTMGEERILAAAVPLSTLPALASQNKTTENRSEKDTESSFGNSNEANHNVKVGEHPDDNPTEVSYNPRRSSLPFVPTTPNGHGLQEAGQSRRRGSLVDGTFTDVTCEAREAIRTQDTSVPREYRQQLPQDHHTPRLPNGQESGKASHALTESQVQGNATNDSSFRLSRTIESAENGQPVPHYVHAHKISSGHELQKRSHTSSHSQLEGNPASGFRNANADTFLYERTSDSPVCRQPMPQDDSVPRMQRDVMTPKQRSSSAAPDTVVRQLPESGDNPDSPTCFVFCPRRRHSAVPGNIAYKRTGYSASPQTASPISPINDMSPLPSTSVVLLGHSVFSPVREIEQIRDEFNRKAGSRAASVARGEQSRPPSAMSQSDGPCARMPMEPEPVVRQRLPSADVVRTSRPKPWTENLASGLSTSTYGRVTSPQWVLKPAANATQDAFLSRIPVPSSRTVLERKVTETCAEKDADGRALSAWNNQEWLGRFEERDAGGRVTQHQSYENTFKNLESM